MGSGAVLESSMATMGGLRALEWTAAVVPPMSWRRGFGGEHPPEVKTMETLQTSTRFSSLIQHESGRSWGFDKLFRRLDLRNGGSTRQKPQALELGRR